MLSTQWTLLYGPSLKVMSLRNHFQMFKPLRMHFKNRGVTLDEKIVYDSCFSVLVVLIS